MLINIRLSKSVRDSSHCRAHVLSNSIDLRFEIKYAMILFFMQKKKTIQQPFYSLCAFIVQWLILDLVTMRLTYCICICLIHSNSYAFICEEKNINYQLRCLLCMCVRLVSRFNTTDNWNANHQPFFFSLTYALH